MTMTITGLRAPAVAAAGMRMRMKMMNTLLPLRRMAAAVLVVEASADGMAMKKATAKLPSAAGSRDVEANSAVHAAAHRATINLNMQGESGADASLLSCNETR